MQDFYDSIPDFSTNKKQDFYSGLTDQTQQTQNFSQNFQDVNNFLRQYSYDEWQGFDWLSNEYPRFASLIQEGRKKGIPDHVMAKVFAEKVEPMLNFAGNPQQVNSWLGRTQQTMEQGRLFQQAKLLNNYRQYFPDKSEQDISDALWLSQDSGISAAALLKYPELSKAMLKGRPAHYQFFGDKRDSIPEGWSTWDIFKDRMLPENSPLRIGFHNFTITREVGNLGNLAWRGKISTQEALQKKRELIQQYLPQPVNQGGFYPAFEGASSIMAQGLSTGTRASLTGTALKPIGWAIGAPLGVAARFGGGMFALGAMITSAYELWQLSAGNKFLELAEMQDKDGKPIDENAARIAASLDGAVTLTAELAGLPTISRLLGINKLYGFKDSPFKLSDAILNNQELLQGLSQVAKQYGQGVWWGAFNNTAEAIGGDASIVLAKKLSGQEFLSDNPDFLRNAENTFFKSVKDFGIAGSIGAFRMAYNLNNALEIQAREDQKAADALGLSVPEYRKKLAGYVQQAEQIMQEKQQIQDDAHEQIQQKTQSHHDNQQDTLPDTHSDTTQEENIQLQQEQSDPLNVPYIFVPTDELQNFLQNNKDVDIQNSFETGNETAIPREQFEKLKTEHPEFIQSIGNRTRYGAEEKTPQEVMDDLNTADTEKATAYHSPEIQALIEQETKQFSKSDMSPEQAENAAKIVGAIAASVRSRFGVDVQPINIQTVDELETQERNYTAMMQEEYDINNPSTWVNTDRAKELLKAAQGNLSVLDRFIKGLLDKQSSEIDIDIEGVDETGKKSMSSIIRQEARDYVRAISTANEDALRLLRDRSDFDSALYELNTKFPSGKNRNSDKTYEYDNYDGLTRINIAESNGDLFVKTKAPGIEQFVFSVKNFREADFRDMLEVFANGLTAKGLEIARAPVIRSIADALRDFWTEQGMSILQQFGVHGEKIDSSKEHNTPDVHTIEKTTPEVRTIETNTPTVQSAPLSSAQLENISTERLANFQAQMPQLAQDNLAADSTTWSETTEDILTDPNVTARNWGNKAIVMQTPLVFGLAGMQGKQVVFRKNKLAAIQDSILGKHGSMTLDMVKDIVPKLANPIAIFEDSDNASQSGKIVLIDMMDNNGASVIVPIVQDGDNLRFASAYPKAETKGKKKGQPKNQWFRNAVLDGRLLYINTEKAAQWAQQTGVNLIEPGESIPEGVKTQLDLQNAWDDNRQFGYYKSDQSGRKLARIYWGDYGRAIVQLLVGNENGADFATHVHEIGHAMFGIIDEIAEAGSEQMLKDRDYVINRAGFSVDQWIAEKPHQTGGVREKVHEWFADAFTVYLSEGKAPNAELEEVFNNARKFLLEIYNDITQQLGIELNDLDRELFHKLLSEPGKDSDSVADFALQQNMIDKEIDNANERIRAILQEQAISNADNPQQELAATELDEGIVRQLQDFADRSNDLVQEGKGNISNVVTSKGTEIETRYKVVEADQLITSHDNKGNVNPAFPLELQPRQRSRAANLDWLQKNTSKIDPEQLADSRLVSTGAPIVGTDNIVESGNGRVLLIREAYNGFNGNRYHQWLIQNAHRFGLDTQQIKKLKHPVLVRERITDVDRVVFTREANESNVATLSRPEQAINDANKLTTNILTAYDPNKPLAANSEFLQAFARIVPDTELGDFMQANGEISRNGLDRVISALMAKAYGNPELINNITESIGSDISNVVSALISAAPSIAVLQNGQYNPELFIGNDIVQAVQTLQILRREGRTIQEWITQPSLFGDDISDTAKTLLQFFDTNKTSYKRIAAGLRLYATDAMQEATTGQLLLFEDSARDKATILNQAINDAENGDAQELVEPVSAAFFERFNNDGKVSPTIPINHNTFAHSLALYGAFGTMKYLKQRKKFLNASHKRKANSKAELERINHYIKQLESTYRDEIKEAMPNITKKDLRKATNEGIAEGRRRERIKQAEEQDTANQLAEAKFQKEIQSLQEESYSAIQKLKQSLQDERANWQQKLYEQQQEAEATLQREQADLRGQIEQAVHDTEKARTNERLEWQRRLDRTIRDMQTARTAALNKANERAKGQVAKLQKRIDNLKSSLRSLNDKHGIKRTVKRIISMGKSKNILWNRHEEIQNIIERLDRDKSPEAAQRREIIRQFLELKDSEAEGSSELIEQLANEQDITQEDIDDFSSKIHLADMTLAEVRELAQQVKDIYQQGRREYDIWKEQQRLKSVDMFNRMKGDILSKTKEPDKKLVTEGKDLNRQFKLGVMDELAAHYWDAVMSPGRYLEGLGESFRNILGDELGRRKGEADARIHQREKNVWAKFSQLGLSPFSFTKTATTIDGHSYSWQNVMEIFAGMQNPYSADAILFGNLVGEKEHHIYRMVSQGREAIRQLQELINQPENQHYKQAVDIILQDFEDNFPYIQEKLITNFNRGMEQQDNYSPIFRLVHQSSGGLLIEENSESILADSSPEQLLAKVADGFTMSRVKIKPGNQQPISLNFIDNWYRAMQIQEYNAALAGPAALLIHALLGKDAHGNTIQSMIKARYGAHAWSILRNIFNSSITDIDVLESDAAEKLASYLMQARSFAFVAFSPSSILSQFFSYALALSYSNRGHFFRSLFKAVEMGITGRGEQFMESVYEKYPSLRNSGGDPYVRQAMQAKKYTSPIRAKYFEWAYKGVQWMDRATKAIVFDIVYESQLDNGASYDDAVRLAIRAVEDTQPASSAREMADVFKTKGMGKLMLLQFMNALSPVFNVGVIDVARNLASPSFNNIKKAAWCFIGAGLSVALGGLIKDAFSGRLPTGEELPNGDEDSWGRWLTDTTIENLINTVPLVNSILTGLYRKARHKPSYSPLSRLFEPVENIISAFAPLTDDDEDTGFNVDKFIRGISLIGIPIPYSGGKQLLRWLGAFDEE